MHKMTNHLLFLFLLVFSVRTAACESKDAEWSRTVQESKNTIKGPFSIAELEKEHMIEIRESKKMLPFGYNNKNWEILKSKYVSGDLIYFVKFQDGRFFVEHHVLVRGECIIDSMMGRIS